MFKDLFFFFFLEMGPMFRDFLQQNDPFGQHDPIYHIPKLPPPRAINTFSSSFTYPRDLNFKRSYIYNASSVLDIFINTVCRTGKIKAQRTPPM